MLYEEQQKSGELVNGIYYDGTLDVKRLKLGEPVSGVCYDKPVLFYGYNKITGLQEISGACFGLEQPDGNRISVGYHHKNGNYIITEEFSAFALGKKIEIIPYNKGCVYLTKSLKFIGEIKQIELF